MYRSRLQSVEERTNLRKALWWVVGAGGVIVVMMVVGVPLLIRMAIFLGEVRSSGKGVEKTDVIAPVPPSLAVSYDATNSARQTLAGLAEAGTTVYLTQNGESKGNVVVRENGGFVFGDIVLKEGNNTFGSVAVDQAGNRSQPAKEVTIYYSNKQPKLEIESPTNRQQVMGKQVEIKGTTTGTRLTVNERLIILGAEGKFNTVYNLEPGENVLVFSAVDQAGNQIRKELIVTAIP